MSAPEDMKPLYKQFSWLPPILENDANARFASNVLAVTYGCSTIANLIRRNDMAADNGDPPLFPSQDADCLIGLMIFSVDTLRDMAEDQIDRLDAVALKGAKS